MLRISKLKNCLDEIFFRHYVKDWYDYFAESLMEFSCLGYFFNIDFYWVLQLYYCFSWYYIIRGLYSSHYGKDWIIIPKNWGTKVATDFTLKEHSAPRTIEENKILGAVLELPAKQHSQFGPFLGKRARLAVLFSW